MNAPDVDAGRLERRVRQLATENRGYAIANRILKYNQSIKEVSKYYGIGPVRTREILHEHCRRNNKALYESLKHSNTYKGGWTNDDCYPLLNELQKNAYEFMKPNDRVEGRGEND